MLHYSTPHKKRLMLPRNQSPLKSPRCKISTGSCKSYHRRAFICCKYNICGSLLLSVMLGFDILQENGEIYLYMGWSLQRDEMGML